MFQAAIAAEKQDNVEEVSRDDLLDLRMVVATRGRPKRGDERLDDTRST